MNLRTIKTQHRMLLIALPQPIRQQHLYQVHLLEVLLQIKPSKLLKQLNLLKNMTLNFYLLMTLKQFNHVLPLLQVSVLCFFAMIKWKF